MMTRDQIELMGKNIQGATGSWETEVSKLLKHADEQWQRIEQQAQEIERLERAYTQTVAKRDITIQTLREALEHARFTGHRFNVSDCSGCREAQRVLEETKR